MVEKILDLGWGEPVCVRETLASLYKPTDVSLNLESLKYPMVDGEEELVRSIKYLIKKTTDIDYENVVITNGCNQALNIVLRHLKPDVVRVNKFTYPYYSDILIKNGCEEVNFEHGKTDAQIIDSPSNPEGEINNQDIVGKTIIWDSVYHNPIYMSDLFKNQIPHHDIMCGSLSKVTGLTGLRIGFIAFNKPEYLTIKRENQFENNGISGLSQSLALDILDNVDLDDFFVSSRMKVDLNREELSKLEGLFPGIVPKNGSFYFTQIDNSLEKLLKKSKVLHYPFLDGKYKYARFNLAQNNKLTQKAVKSILQTDRR